MGAPTCGTPLLFIGFPASVHFAAYPGVVTHSKHGRGNGSEQRPDQFQVYALRERGTGTIVFVGRRIHDGDDANDNNGALTSPSSFAERADDLELVVLAQRVGDPGEALRIENAVVAAYRAVQLTPARSSAANTVNLDRSGPVGGPDQSDSSTAGAIPSEGPNFLDGEHRQRLEDLILRQHSELAALTEALDRVRALRDLQQWADGDGHVRVSDMNRALGSTS